MLVHYGVAGTLLDLNSANNPPLKNLPKYVRFFTTSKLHIKHVIWLTHTGQLVTWRLNFDLLSLFCIFVLGISLWLRHLINRSDTLKEWAPSSPAVSYIINSFLPHRKDQGRWPKTLPCTSSELKRRFPSSWTFFYAYEIYIVRGTQFCLIEWDAFDYTIVSSLYLWCKVRICKVILSKVISCAENTDDLKLALSCISIIGVAKLKANEVKQVVKNSLNLLSNTNIKLNDSENLLLPYELLHSVLSSHAITFDGAKRLEANTTVSCGIFLKTLTMAVRYVSPCLQ